MQSNPMKVMPCWCLPMEFSLKNSPLLNRIPDSSPERSVTSIKIKPNSYRFTHQILLRNEPRRVLFVEPAAVLAVIAIIAHEEVMTCGHRPFARFDAPIGKHDAMLFGLQLLEGRRH